MYFPKKILEKQPTLIPHMQNVDCILVSFIKLE